MCVSYASQCTASRTCAYFALTCLQKTGWPHRSGFRRMVGFGDKRRKPDVCWGRTIKLLTFCHCCSLWKPHRAPPPTWLAAGTSALQSMGAAVYVLGWVFQSAHISSHIYYGAPDFFLCTNFCGSLEHERILNLIIIIADQTPNLHTQQFPPPLERIESFSLSQRSYNGWSRSSVFRTYACFVPYVTKFDASRSV